MEVLSFLLCFLSFTCISGQNYEENSNESHLQWALSKLMANQDACAPKEGDPQNMLGPLVGPTGRPGKEGPRGEKGDRGIQGPVGEKGECVCDLSEVKALRREIQELKAVIATSQNCLAGMKDGTIPNKAISASSTSSILCHHLKSRLDAARGWCAEEDDQESWIQADLGEIKRISGVVTQGRSDADEWVTSFRIKYGDDESNLQYVAENGEIKVFMVDVASRNQKVFSWFPEPVTGCIFRIEVVTFHNHPSMRFDLVDC